MILVIVIVAVITTAENPRPEAEAEARVCGGGCVLGGRRGCHMHRDDD